MKIFLLFVFVTFQLQANPFAISFPTKEEVTNGDYIEIQKQLRTIDIRPLLKKLYVPDQGYTTLEDFEGRTSRGIRRVLIDPAKGLYPIAKLEKMGEGGDCCIVSCAPYDGVRSAMLAAIPEALRATGFNGYFYYRLGGFPNPTGREIQYVGVPYCFKIFMMIEAEKLGFNKVLWIDSACLPIRDPKPLFRWLEQTGIYYHGSKKNPENIRRYILSQTRELLKELTGVDVLHAVKIDGALFGLKMNTPEAKKLIQDFYQMVEKGTPFLSCFPEEFVLSALIGKLNCSHFKPSPFPFLTIEMEKALREGYFFCFMRH